MTKLFCDWFEGKWSNRNQAYRCPRSAAYVHVEHRRLSENEFHCTYRYEKKKQPYRSFKVKIHHEDGHIVVKNPEMDIVFRLENGCFVASTDQKLSEDIFCTNKAYLGSNHYHVMDKGIDIKTGRLIWGLEDDAYFEFERVGSA